MAKTQTYILIIMRHGEAEDIKGFAEDFDRRLTAQGKEDIKNAAQRFARLDLPLKMAKILVSAAQRTRETWEHFQKAMAVEKASPLPEPSFLKSLYNADEEQCKKILAKEASAQQYMMLVGHNPTVSQLVSTLYGSRIKMATSNIAVLALQQNASNWHEALEMSSCWDLAKLL